MKYLDIFCRCLVIAMFVEMQRNQWSGVEISAFLAHNLGLGGFFYGMGWLICWPVRAWLSKPHTRNTAHEIARAVEFVPARAATPATTVQPSPPPAGSNRFHARHN